VASHEGLRSEHPGKPPPEVSVNKAERVEERTAGRNCWTVRTKRVMRFPIPSPPLEVTG
jgi:hypothetical protein